MEITSFELRFKTDGPSGSLSDLDGLLMVRDHLDLLCGDYKPSSEVFAIFVEFLSSSPERFQELTVYLKESGLSKAQQISTFMSRLQSTISN